MSPDELAIDIDKKLQSECLARKIKSDDGMPRCSTSAGTKNLDYTDYASHPGKLIIISSQPQTNWYRILSNYSATLI